jgi:hypothetical protein
MTKINHEEERRRLADIYASKSDLELTELARTATSLTEDAKEVLEQEFVTRGLILEKPLLLPADLGEKDKKLVILQRFRDLPEAMLAKTVLESAGVPCFLADENTVRMDWMWSNALGGIKLWVREEDVAEATGLLQNDTSKELTSDETDPLHEK